MNRAVSSRRTGIPTGATGNIYCKRLAEWTSGIPRFHHHLVSSGRQLQLCTDAIICRGENGNVVHVDLHSRDRQVRVRSGEEAHRGSGRRTRGADTDGAIATRGASLRRRGGVEPDFNFTIHNSSQIDFPVFVEVTPLEIYRGVSIHLEKWTRAKSVIGILRGNGYPGDVAVN